MSHPYGWMLPADAPPDPRLVHNVREQSVIRLIVDLRERGMAQTSIVEYLEAAAIPTRTGKPWSQALVSILLNRERARVRLEATD